MVTTFQSGKGDLVLKRECALLHSRKPSQSGFPEPSVACLVPAVGTVFLKDSASTLLRGQHIARLPIKYKATFIGWLFAFRGIGKWSPHFRVEKVTQYLSANARCYSARNHHKVDYPGKSISCSENRLGSQIHVLDDMHPNSPSLARCSARRCCAAKKTC